MSDEIKFTSGKWSLEGDRDGALFVVSPEQKRPGQEICRIVNGVDGDDSISRTQDLANAHLIAAAPALYREGEASVVTCEEVAEMLDAAIGDATSRGLSRILRERAAAQRAALSQARGEK